MQSVMEEWMINAYADVNSSGKILRSQLPQLRHSELLTDFQLDGDVPCRLQSRLHFQVLLNVKKMYVHILKVLLSILRNAREAHACLVSDQLDEVLLALFSLIK